MSDQTAIKSSRPTIGLLTAGLSGGNNAQQWAGVVNAASQRQVNLITYVGGAVGQPEDRHANAIYDLAAGGRTDGLVIWAGNMLWRCLPSEVDAFIERFAPQPVVACEKTASGSLGLLLEDYEGMRQIVMHLINEHQHRRIVYLRGPQTHIGAVERYRAYCAALAEAGIPLDERLVSPAPLTWDSTPAAMGATLEAMHLTPGVDYTALVATSSYMALGAMTALQEAGVNIPGQAAVVGFDESPENLIQQPPLTTVLSPFYEMARRAVEALLDKMEQKPLPEVITQPTQLLIRRSCGCLGQASAMSEEVEHTLLKRIFQQEQLAILYRETSAGLIAASNMSELLQSFVQALPRLSIPACYIALYANPAEPAGEMRLILAYDQNRRVELPPDGLHYPAAKIIPDEFFPQARAVSLLVEPIYFQQVALGFIVFEVSGINGESIDAQHSVDGQRYETLREQLGSALYKITLIESETRERQQTEQALRHEQYLMKVLMDNLPDTIYFKDKNSRFMRFNHAMIQRMGKNTAEEVLEKSDFDFFTEEHARPAYEDEQRIMRTGQPILDKEEKEFYADGHVAWVSTSKMPLLDENGQTIGTFGVSRDITSRKLADEALAREHDQLKTLLENIPDQIYFKDRQSRILISNPAHTYLMGFLIPEEIIGKTDFDIFGSAAQSMYDEEQRLMEKNQPLIGRVGQTAYPSGQTLWLSETKIPISDPNGKVIGLVGISRDITALQKAELQAKRRAVQVETAAEVSRAASSILDPEELIRKTVDLIRERFDLYYVGLFLVNEEDQLHEQRGRWAVLRAGTGEAGRQMLARGHKLEIGDTSMIGWCIAHQQGRIALDVGKDAVRFRNPALPETRSELAIPLISRGEVSGALSIQSSQPAAFTNEDITLFQTMADQLANALTNARLYERTESALKEMQATYQRFISQGWSAYIHTQPQSGFLRNNDEIQPLGRQVLPEVQQAVTEQRPLILSEAENPTLVVPIQLRGQAIGAIGLKANEGSYSWSEEEISLIEILTEQFALTAENLRLLDDTQRRAERERMVAEITSKLRSSNDPQTILQTAVSELRQALRAKDARVFVQNQPKGTK